MAKSINELKLFLSSPSGLSEEKEAIKEFIIEFNKTTGDALNIKLDLVTWETDALPGFDESAQNVINKSIGNGYDIFVGIMWDRFGTPTNNAGSGTEEEFNRAYERFQKNPNQLKIAFYFKQAPLKPLEIDIEQLSKVKEFKKKISKKGLYFDYTSLDDFKNFIRIHLRRYIQEWGKSWGIEENAIEVEGETPKEDENDEGLFDLFDKGDKSFEEATESGKKILAAITEFNQRISERMTQINNFNNSGNKNKSLLMQILKKHSEDIDAMTNKFDENMPKFSDTFADGIDNYSKAIVLQKEIYPENKSELEKWYNVVKDLKKQLYATIDQMKSFGIAFDSYPKLSTLINRSRSKAKATLQNYISILEQAVLQIEALESNFQ